MLVSIGSETRLAFRDFEPYAPRNLAALAQLKYKLGGRETGYL